MFSITYDNNTVKVNTIFSSVSNKGLGSSPINLGKLSAMWYWVGGGIVRLEFRRQQPSTFLKAKEVGGYLGNCGSSRHRLKRLRLNRKTK